MKKLVSLLLVLAMLIALPLLTACGDTESDPNPTDPVTVRVWTLNGTTGFGMAQLIDADTKGEAELDYEFTVEANAANVQSALINGDADIAALPTNAASVLYNKTKGEVVLLALNTRGVLYLMANTAKVTAPTSLSDLAGKTVYVPAQNPTFITKALIDKAAVSGVTLDSTTYAEPAALRDALASGLVDYAVLPEPMVTIAKSKAAEGVTLTTALDLTTEWDKYFTAGSLVQGCIVARKEFVTAHPNEVKKFLEEYEASIHFAIEDPASTAAMIVDAGIFAQAPVAQNALPKCNLCYLEGAEMKAAMQAFLAAMPINSIGGALPGNDFYYGA